MSMKLKPRPILFFNSKVHSDGQLACDLYMFVNSKQLVGASKTLTWTMNHVLVTKQSSHGIYDSTQKVLPCSQPQ